jgi:hypothetical protein
MDIKEVIEYYESEIERLSKNTWEAVEALFPNIDLDFWLSQPNVTKLVVKHARFLQKLPKGTKVVFANDVEFRNYYGVYVYIYLPPSGDRVYWSQRLKEEDHDECRFELKEPIKLSKFV